MKNVFKSAIAALISIICLATGAAQAATVTINLTGTINSVTPGYNTTLPQGFNTIPGVQVGESYTMAIGIDDATPLTGVYLNGNAHIYQQAITSVSLAVGSSIYGLQTQAGGQNNLEFISGSYPGFGGSDQVKFQSTLVGPDKAGHPVGYMSTFLRFPTGMPLNGSMTSLFSAIANSTGASWAGSSFNMLFGADPFSPQFYFSGGVTSVALAPVGVSPVPLPASFGLLALGLAGLGGMRRKPRKPAPV